MEINPVTEVAIIGIITSLKSKNSSGYDEVPSKIIKLCGLQIGRSFCYVCIKYICVGIFPDHLKYAIVKPVYIYRMSDELRSLLRENVS